MRSFTPFCNARHSVAGRTVALFVLCQALGVALLTGCGRGERQPAVDAAASPVGGRDGGQPGEALGADDWFVDRAEAAGLRFVHFNGMSGRFYFPEMLPGGVGLLDYDGDGDLDVYLVQGQMLGEDRTLKDALVAPKEAVPLRGRLFRNDLQVEADGTRRLRFADVTDGSGIEARGYGMGVAAGDFDNNGCVDLYLTNFGPNQMYRNDCDGTFTDVSATTGTDDGGWSVSASFLDYDRDGWLDLYVGKYVQYDVKSDRPCTGLTGRRDYCTPAVYPPQPDRLYRNMGNGRFVDVTAKALVGGPFGPALGVVTADFNNDGWIDVYVANDGKENLLWLNQRNGTFDNVGLLSGAALSGDGKPEASMGVDAGDFDNDGDEDLYMTHLPAEGNNLYVNDGTGLFEDASARSGLGPASLGYSGFGTAWFDFDNDGWLEVLAVNGAIEAIKGRLDETFPYSERSRLFRNLGDGRFVDVTEQAGAAFSRSDVGRGAAFGDIDNDGDIDVLVGNLHSPARLLVNNTGNRRHWAGLRLLGAQGRDALGARVEIVGSNGSSYWRRARSDGSYASANDPRVLVGLGDAAGAPKVRVRWPSGAVEEWPNVAIDAWSTLTEGTGRRPQPASGAATRSSSPGQGATKP